jgi:hypothetical protein
VCTGGIASFGGRQAKCVRHTSLSAACTQLIDMDGWSVSGSVVAVLAVLLQLVGVGGL